MRNRWNRSVGILGCCFLIAASTLRAQTDPKEYRYFPDSKLALGLGFNPNDLSDVKLPCIDFKERALTAGAASTKLTANYVASAQDVSNASNLDVRASAEYLGGSASAHFNLDTSETFSESSVNVVVNAVTDYGQWAMAPNPEPQLTQRAEALLKSSPGTFAKTCGTRYISMEHRASAAGVVISISSVRHSWKEAFVAEASGGYGGGGMSASASMKFSSELKTALAEHRVSFQTFSTGGDGFGSLGDMCKGLAGQDNPMDAIASGLSTFLKTFGKSNAAIYSFSVSSMEYFGWDRSQDVPWSDSKSSQLGSIVDEYRKIGERIANAENFAEPDSVWRRAICEETQCHATFVSFQTSLIHDAKEYQAALREAYDTCKTKQELISCPVPSLPTRLISFYGIFAIPPPPVVQFGVVAQIHLQPGEHFTPDNMPQGVFGVRARAVLNAPENLRLNVLQSFHVRADGLQVMMILKGRFLETSKIVFVNSQNGTETALTTEGGETGGSAYWYSMPPEPNFDYLPKLHAALASFTRQDQDYSASGTVFLDVTDKMGRSFRLGLFDVDFSSSDGALTQIKEDYDYVTEKVPDY